MLETVSDYSELGIDNQPMQDGRYQTPWVFPSLRLAFDPRISDETLRTYCRRALFESAEISIINQGSPDTLSNEVDIDGKQDVILNARYGGKSHEEFTALAMKWHHTAVAYAHYAGAIRGVLDARNAGLAYEEIAGGKKTIPLSALAVWFKDYCQQKEIVPNAKKTDFVRWANQHFVNSEGGAIAPRSFGRIFRDVDTLQESPDFKMRIDSVNSAYPFR